MRDLKNKLTDGKNSKNTQSRRGKSFGYQVLGFGAGGSAGPVEVDYLVLAGGGAGGRQYGGGGGAGGYRTSFPCGTKIELDSGDNDVVVGAGGAESTNDCLPGPNGSDSSVGCITSAGGGGGGSQATGSSPTAGIGGSGGGGAYATCLGAGNTPSTSPVQGYPGGAGNGAPYYVSGGGGGASVAGTAALDTIPRQAGPGGNGLANSITASSVTRGGGGGGGGGGCAGQPYTGGAGGSGGGGTGKTETIEAGDAALGGGGGGSSGTPAVNGAAGGSGTVIVRIASADAPAGVSVSPGTNSLATDSPTGDKIATFTVTGVLTL